MIKASKAGFLFRTTDKIKKDYPELKAFETYDELFEALLDAGIEIEDLMRISSLP